MTLADEPTAALDAETEGGILDMLLALKKEEKVILLITHRMSTLSTADKVIQIKNGKIS